MAHGLRQPYNLPKKNPSDDYPCCILMQRMAMPKCRMEANEFKNRATSSSSATVILCKSSDHTSRRMRGKCITSQNNRNQPACEISPRAHGSRVSHANETNVNQHFSTRQLERFLHRSELFWISESAVQWLRQENNPTLWLILSCISISASDFQKKSGRIVPPAST